MNASNFIAAHRQLTPAASLTHLAALVTFEPGEPAFGEPTDKNLEFRAAVVEALLPDFSMADYELIQILFAEETKCEAAIRRHDSLYQLCFYLFELGQLPDIFRLYEAKFEATNMDVGLTLDREMILVGHEAPEVIAYVQQVFINEPPLQARYPTLLQALQALVEYPSYESCAQYRASLRDYFYEHEGEDSPPDFYEREEKDRPPAPTGGASGYQTRPKPWWRFW